MLDIIKKSMRGMIVYTLVILVIGIIFAIAPQESIKIMNGFIAVVSMLLGGYFIFDYIRAPKEQKLLNFSLAFGIILIGIGIFLFLKPDLLVNFITVLVGIILVVKAIYKVQTALYIRKITKAWKYNLLVGLLIFTAGLLLIIYPSGSAEIFLRIIGIVLAVGSIGELAETAFVMGTLKDVNNQVQEKVQEIPFQEK